VKAQYDPIIADLDWRIKEAERRLFEKWDDFMGDRWKAALERMDGLRKEQREVLNEVWGVFEDRWGLGRGNGVRWRDEDQV
jgi:hypothetical protein